MPVANIHLTSSPASKIPGRDLGVMKEREDELTIVKITPDLSSFLDALGKIIEKLEVAWSKAADRWICYCMHPLRMEGESNDCRARYEKRFGEPDGGRDNCL